MTVPNKPVVIRTPETTDTLELYSNIESGNFLTSRKNLPHLPDQLILMNLQTIFIEP